MCILIDEDSCVIRCVLQSCKRADKHEPKPGRKSDLKQKPGMKSPKIRLDLKLCSVARNQILRCS